MTVNRTVRLSATLLFVAAMGLGAAFHVPTVWKALRQRKGSEPVVSTVRRELQSQFRWKSTFVDISGLHARLLGRRVHNQVIRLANGQLHNVTRMEPTDAEIVRTKDSAVRISELFAWLKDRGIGALYLQAPSKMDARGALYPYEVRHRVYEKSDIVCSELLANGHEVVDMRKRLAETPDDVGRNFYVTDHHWKIDAAFRVFPEVADGMLSVLGRDRKPIASVADPCNWIRQTRTSWFLGSWGRRAGRFFAGLDDISWYEPKFDTHMSCAIPLAEQICAGTFAEALVRYAWFLDRRPSLHDSSPYSLYVGGNFPLVSHRNASAPVQARVLLVIDSFALPMQAFLSTVFSEIDVLDLRSFKEMTLCDYVDARRPDLVTFLYNPGSIGADATFDFGLSEANRRKPSPRKSPCSRSLDIAKGSGGKPYVVVVDSPMLENGGLYGLELGEFVVRGSCPGVIVCLRNPETGECREKRVVDTEYAARHIETLAFKIPSSGRWELVAFADRRSAAAGAVRIGTVALVCVRPAPAEGRIDSTTGS